MDLLASSYDQVDVAERKINVIAKFESYLKSADSLLKDDEDLFAFWKQQKNSYPIMYSMACEILITSAINTAVEHLFSSNDSALTESCQHKN